MLSMPAIKKKSDTKSAYMFIVPYFMAFLVFITIPVIIGMLLSFTYFNLIQAPEFIGFSNYVYLFTSDDAFMQNVIPNTLQFVVIVGPVGYMLGFFLAWMLAQLPSKLRTVLALIIYSPSMTAGITMAVMWRIIFSGDESGYLNAFLLNLNVITQPIQWLQNPNYYCLS